MKNELVLDAALGQLGAWLTEVQVPWCLGGGWAIDGWVGHATRAHVDVDVVIWREDQRAFRAALGDDWEWEKYVNRMAAPWPLEEYVELPVHNGHAKRGAETLEVLMLEREGAEWVFRRDARVRMPAARVILPTGHGMQVLNPAIALLFKSNRLEEKDWYDLQVVWPLMAREDQQWLLGALRVIDPAHAWLGELGG